MCMRAFTSRRSLWRDALLEGVNGEEGMEMMILHTRLQIILNANIYWVWYCCLQMHKILPVLSIVKLKLYIWVNIRTTFGHAVMSLRMALSAYLMKLQRVGCSHREWVRASHWAEPQHVWGFYQGASDVQHHRQLTWCRDSFARTTPECWM